MEIDRVGEIMSEVEREGDCVTIHPGFQDVCLNRWVLEVASLTLKTKAGKNYRTLFSQGLEAESERVIFCFIFWKCLFVWLGNHIEDVCFVEWY